MFKYISFNKTMTQLSSTLSRVCYSYILNFTIKTIILTFLSVLLMSWDLESCLQLYFLLLLSLAIYFLELKYVFFFHHFKFNFELFMMFIFQVKAFSNFDDAVFTLLRTILGDFDFHAIESANRFLGPIYFLSYVFFVFFVLLVCTKMLS